MDVTPDRDWHFGWVRYIFANGAVAQGPIRGIRLEDGEMKFKIDAVGEWPGPKVKGPTVLEHVEVRISGRDFAPVLIEIDSNLPVPEGQVLRKGDTIRVHEQRVTLR